MGIDTATPLTVAPPPVTPGEPVTDTLDGRGPWTLPLARGRDEPQVDDVADMTSFLAWQVGLPAG